MREELLKGLNAEQIAKLKQCRSSEEMLKKVSSLAMTSSKPSTAETAPPHCRFARAAIATKPSISLAPTM